MQIVYAILSVKKNMVDNVLDSLSAYKNVVESHRISDTSIIVKTVGETWSDVGVLLVDVREIAGVLESKTLPVISGGL